LIGLHALRNHLKTIGLSGRQARWNCGSDLIIAIVRKLQWACAQGCINATAVEAEIRSRDEHLITRNRHCLYLWNGLRLLRERRARQHDRKTDSTQ
jgi:hypothetical protein